MRAAYLLSEHNSRSGGHIYNPAGRNGGCGSRFVPTNSVLKTKKWSSARTFTLRFGVHSCFLSWNETLLTLGGRGTQAVICRARALKCTPVAAGLFLFLGRNSRFGGHISCLRGTSSGIVGTAPKCPHYAGLLWIRSRFYAQSTAVGRIAIAFLTVLLISSENY